MSNSSPTAGLFVPNGDDLSDVWRRNRNTAMQSTPKTTAQRPRHHTQFGKQGTKIEIFMGYRQNDVAVVCSYLWFKISPLCKTDRGASDRLALKPLFLILYFLKDCSCSSCPAWGSCQSAGEFFLRSTSRRKLTGPTKVRERAHTCSPVSKQAAVVTSVLGSDN